VTTDLTGGDAPIFDANSISEALADSGNVYAGTVTADGTYTGASSTSYLIEIVTGGPRPVAEYRVSEDGGLTWGSALKFGGGTIDVYDDVNGTDLGVDATFENSTFAVGDRFVIDAFVPTVQAAADAQVAIGSGAGQITIASASNTVTGLLPGVTLNLQKADADQVVEIAVANDTATIVEQVQAFVDSYNEVATYIREQTRYNSETGTAGLLLGNTSMVRIEQDLREAIFGAVPGLPTGWDGLYALGVSVSTSGQLSLDAGELESALAEDFDAAARIFKASGDSTHAKIRFAAAASDTVASTEGYAVHITQGARRGELVGTSISDPANSPLTIDDTNDELVLMVSGTETSTLTLAHKTYASGSELANEIAAKIADSDVAVGTVDVTWVDEGATGHLELLTAAYGSGKSVALGTPPANNAATVLGLTGGTSTDGQDVAGTIDGYAAEGSGRILRATDADSAACGLQLQVTLEPEEVGGGVDATVTVIKGVAALADGLLDYLTDPIDGYVKSKEDRFAAQVERYRAQIERKEELLAKRRERLVARFARLESAIASLQSQSSYLSMQLSSLSGMADKE
jgi:flagellar hook-associated protein 2